MVIRGFTRLCLDRKNVVITFAGDRRSYDEIVAVLDYVERDAPYFRICSGDCASNADEESAEEIVEVADVVKRLSFLNSYCFVVPYTSFVAVCICLLTRK